MIKKNFLLIGLMLLLPALPVCSQKKFHVIPKFGRVFSDITNIESEMKAGTYLGLGFDWRITWSLWIETGLYYAQYGAKNMSLEFSELPPSTVKINYAQLPLMAKYYVYKGLHIAAGPQIGYRINSSEKPINVIGYGKEFDIDGVIGIGYQFDFGLLLLANYVAGFTNNDQTPFFESAYTPDGSIYYPNEVSVPYKSQHRRNTALQVSIGWRF